jgi:hypothetical protein
MKLDQMRPIFQIVNKERRDDKNINFLNNKNII